MQLAENDVQGAGHTLAELVVRVPDLAEGQYNYACALARMGDHDGALEHLRSAAQLEPDLLKHAREDEDLKALRGDAKFEKLLTEPPPPAAQRTAPSSPPVDLNSNDPEEMPDGE
jgi:hypothetical protein